MKLRKSLITASIAAAVALGAMGQAQASVYGGAFIEVQNLQISTTGVDDPADPLNCNFSTSNTATLNDVSAPTGAASCSGIISTAATGNDCIITADGYVLDAAASQIGTAQAENTFSTIGPGSGEYARADSAIIDAQLVTGNPTHTVNIAESELQTGSNAQSTSTIQSTTGFLFKFTATGPGSITLSFEADVDLLAAISDTDALTASAQAGTTFTFTLSEDSTGNSVTWSPATTSTGDATCQDSTTTGAGVTCSTQTVAENLNNNVGVTLLPNSEDAYSRSPDADPGFGSYLVTFNWVTADPVDGTQYTLSLLESKSVTVSRLQIPTIPEPTTLLLLGSGLFGMGIARRRIRKA